MMVLPGKPTRGDGVFVTIMRQIRAAEAGSKAERPRLNAVQVNALR